MSRSLASRAADARAALSRPATRSAAASTALGAAFAAIAFVAQGGSELSRTTAVELALLLAGGLIASAAIALAPERPAHGGGTLVLFGLLAVVTGLSISWSITPELSWVHTGKTLAYLFAFAAAVGAARLAPGGWAVLLRGVLVGAGVVTVYALASRVWPGALAENELYARIGQPYDYWNAVGVTAALAIAPTLWLGARRSGHPPANALAFPLLGLLIVALFLSYSRGSLAAAVVGAGLWIAFVPLRLRSLAVLSVAVLGAAPVIVWALSKDAFTEDGVPLQVRESVASEFGLLLAAMTAVLLAAGLAIGFRAARRAPAAHVRRRVGFAGVALACVVPVLAFGSVAFSDRGISGTIDEFTSADAEVSGGPGRLTQAGSSRARYWGEAIDVLGDHPLRGAGANSFRVARLPHRDDELVSSHAHGYLAQTAADLGAIGLLVTLALAGAWLAAAARTVGVRRGGRGLPFDSERVGVVALALCALVFGLQSAIDWTWFVPGPTIMALVAGGFVAGRGPLPALAGGHASGGAGAEPDAAPGGRRRRRRERIVAAGIALAAALLCAWAAWQPERADDASNRALALLDEGRIAEAAREAERAYDIDPLSPKPLFVVASVQQRAGNPEAAADTLERAVVEHAGQPEVWQRLADFQLHVLDRPQAAIDTLRGALYLDPRSRAAQTTFFEARNRLREREAALAQPESAPPIGTPDEP